MTALRTVKISGTGFYVPPRIVTNKDLEKLMDTSDEWIQQRSGIRERRQVDEGVGPAELGFEASKLALAAANTSPEELDLIIVATLSPDYYFPGTSVFLQDMFGLHTTPAMDVRCQCSGFLYALNVAKAFISSGTYKKILVCGTEVHSRAIDFSDRGRDVSVLFGDGAGAVVLEAASNPGQGILSVHLHSEGKHRDKLKIEYPSTRHTPFITKEIIDENKHWPVMDGKFVFKHAVTRVPEVIREALDHNKLTADDIDHYIFHQANLRINEFAMKELEQSPEKAYNNIDRYGNCSAASIPICLDECVRAKRIKPGDLVCLSSFGAGFTWASAIIRW
jgi:3-oxoacyl-[acyl-carrier-protein] synthase-3